MKPIVIQDHLLKSIFQESERAYPEEGCGLVFGVIEQEQRIAKKFTPCTNIQNKVHAQDPERYTRDAKTAYTMDSQEMTSLESQAQKEGLVLLSIFHSHPEHGVYFSAEDKGMAAPWGEPLFPQLSYLVVSVYGGRVKNASEFIWQENDFVEKVII